MRTAAPHRAQELRSRPQLRRKACAARLASRSDPLARTVLHGDRMSSSRPEPDFTTVTLAVLLWATLGIGLIMVMVVLLRS